MDYIELVKEWKCQRALQTRRASSKSNAIKSNLIFEETKQARIGEAVREEKRGIDKTGDVAWAFQIVLGVLNFNSKFNGMPLFEENAP